MDAEARRRAEIQEYLASASIPDPEWIIRHEDAVAKAVKGAEAAEDRDAWRKSLADALEREREQAEEIARLRAVLIDQPDILAQAVRAERERLFSLVCIGCENENPYEEIAPGTWAHHVSPRVWRPCEAEALRREPASGEPTA